MFQGLIASMAEGQYGSARNPAGSRDRVTIQKHCQVCRDGARIGKVQLELELLKDVKDSQKGYEYAGTTGR